MTGAYIALLVGAVSASLISRNNLRGMLWIAASQLAFWISVLYWDLALSLPLLFAAICDSIIVLLIYKYGKYTWEKWLMVMFSACILTNFLTQGFIIFNESFNIYISSWTLYLLNWSMIIFIGSISGLAKLNNVTSYIAFSNWSTFLGRKRIMERQEDRK